MPMPSLIFQDDVTILIVDFENIDGTIQKYLYCLKFKDNKFNAWHGVHERQDVLQAFLMTSWSP